MGGLLRAATYVDATNVTVVLDEHCDGFIVSRLQHSLCCMRMVILGTAAKLRVATISFVVSVRPHGTTRLPTNGNFTKFDI